MNAIVPLILYRLTKRYASSSDVVALSVAALFPLGESIFVVTKSRVLDPIAVLVLVGLLIGMVGAALGGGPKLLLIRESFLTGALGIACFVSLLLPRPLMFYFGRQLMTGGDPDRIGQYEAQWQRPYARFVHRLITVVWGFAFTAEFLTRIVMAYTLPPSLVLAISPLVLGSITLGTIAWTFAFVRHARRRGEALRQAEEMARAHPPGRGMR